MIVFDSEKRKHLSDVIITLGGKPAKPKITIIKNGILDSKGLGEQAPIPKPQL
jgi:hypothetical protein